MKTFFLFVGFVLLLGGVSVAQSKKASPAKGKTACSLTEAPKIRGIFLGQTVDEIDKLIPNFRKAYDDWMSKQSKYNYTFTLSNYSRIVNYPAEIGLMAVSSSDILPWDEDKNKRVSPSKDFEDVEIDWFFFKGSLFSFVVYYRDYEPDSLQDFVKQATETLQLPPKGWEVVNNNTEAALNCANFWFSVDVGNKGTYPHVTVVDTPVQASILNLEKEIKERKRKEEEELLRLEREKHKTFKP